MNQTEIHKCAEQLENRTPLFGARIRRGACRKLAEDSSALAVPPLVKALTSEDAEVRVTAEAALRSLKNPEAVEALCDLVIADPSSPAAGVVKQQDFQPQEVSRRCLLFLLTGQIDRYLDLDFELQYVRAEYQAGDEDLKRRIAEVVRQSGDARLVPILQAAPARARTGGIDKKAGELTESEAAVVLEVYARRARWVEVFSLLFHLPLSAVVSALELLGKSGWQPENEQDAALLKDLLQVRRGVGEIPKAPAAPEVVLGPVVGKWIEAGRAGEGSGWPGRAAPTGRDPPPLRSDGRAGRDAPPLQLPDEELRRRVREAPPPEAVAALAALSSKGQTAPEDIEAARTHQHWPVRLACLALCEVAPEFALSDAPVAGEGGGMWIGQLAPSLLDAAVYRRRALAPNLLDKVEALQRALASPKGKDPSRLACGRLLCALGTHHLRYTIEIEEEMVVRIDESDIEIE